MIPKHFLPEEPTSMYVFDTMVVVHGKNGFCYSVKAEKKDSVLSLLRDHETIKCLCLQGRLPYAHELVALDRVEEVQFSSDWAFGVLSDRPEIIDVLQKSNKIKRFKCTRSSAPLILDIIGKNICVQTVDIIDADNDGFSISHKQCVDFALFLRTNTTLRELNISHLHKPNAFRKIMEPNRTCRVKGLGIFPYNMLVSVNYDTYKSFMQLLHALETLMKADHQSIMGCNAPQLVRLVAGYLMPPKCDLVDVHWLMRLAYSMRPKPERRNAFYAVLARDEDLLNKLLA